MGGSKMEKTSNQKGQLIILATLILGILLFLGFYFLSFTVTELRISESQTVGSQTYYLAEAGINTAIWKLKNDATELDGDVPWATCFVTSTASCVNCNNWSSIFTTSTDVLIPNSTITVTIKNSECGRGEVTVTSTIALPGGKTAKRVVKTKVFKAIGSLTAKSVLFAGSDTKESLLEDAKTYVYSGNIAIRGNFRVNDGTLKVYDDPDPDSQTGLILVGNKIYVTGSPITASSTCSTSTCGPFCPTDGYCPILGGGCPCTKLPSLPTVDFNSTSSSSYYQKAKTAQENGQCEVEGKNKYGNTLFTTSTCIFNYDKFKNLLDQIGTGGTLTLKHKSSLNATSTYYIKGGGFNLIGGRNLKVNGALVAEGTVNIGTDFYGFWCSNGWSRLTIYHPTSTPSGLFTTGKIYFGPCATNPFEEEPTTITGLVYALDELNIEDIEGEYKITGGIITNKFSIHAKNYDLYVDDDIIREGIWGGPKPPGETKPPFSPIVTIEHWEETY